VVWKIDFDDYAKKQFKKLDKYSQHLIQSYLDDRLLKLDHPKKLGKSLSSKLSGKWRYRVDKFRIICEIQEGKLIILILKIGKRDNVYDE
jgi:mRNA interferase RelE/StbE